MRRLGFEKLIDGKASRERGLVVAMVAARIVAPQASKLAMTHAFSDTTLAEDFGVADAHEDELYAAMDWLIERQESIEKRLARRHLKEGGLALQAAAGPRSCRRNRGVDNAALPVSIASD